MTVFEALTWHAADTDDSHVISIFGRTENGKSVCVSTKFEPYFFVKTKIPSIFSVMKGATSYAMVHGKDLWGFQNNEQHAFMKINFNKLSELKSCEWNLRKSHPQMRIYESNLEPLLRFMHRTGIQSTGWLDTGDNCYTDSFSRCDIGLFCEDWTSLKPVECDNLAPFIVASFDIETNSSTGKFPDPNIEEDAVFQIAVTLKRLGELEIYKKVCLCFKKTSGPDIISFETEKDLLLGFRKFLLDKQSFDNFKFNNNKVPINYKERIYLLFYNIIENYFIKYKSDHTALQSKYLNKNLVVCHFTPNLYSTFVLKNLYLNQKVITYSNSINLENITKMKITDYILFIFSPTQINHLKYLIKSLNYIISNYPINKILIRPHPRYQNIADYVTNQIKANYSHIDCKIVSTDESLFKQTYTSKIILGYYSSSFHSIDTKTKKLLLIHKEWTKAELGYDDLNILIGFQFNYNKHFSIIDMNNNILYANEEDQNNLNSKNFSECFMIEDKIFHE